MQVVAASAIRNAGELVVPEAATVELELFAMTIGDADGMTSLTIGLPGWAALGWC